MSLKAANEKAILWAKERHLLRRSKAPVLRVLSLGAGVQSSTMALMAAHDEIGPMPDCAIFADTGWEPKEVYTHLDWLEKQLPFPTYRVSAGNIRDDHIAGLNTTGHRFASMPMFTANGSMGRRQCTREYKIAPIRRKQRELLGLKPRQRIAKRIAEDAEVEVWLGISIDEASRIKPSPEKWQRNHWPLIHLDMSREDCLDWFKEKYPHRKLTRSACIGCPFKNAEEWRTLKHTDPESWEDAVDFDKTIRKNGTKFRGMREQQYLHRSCMPLDEVDFDTKVSNGQLNFFVNECEGMCGV